MSYGVTPQGFSRKPLNVILAEIEEAAIGIFGPALIQSAQSPMGQLNGLFAHLVGIEWEHAEDVYQSYDPDQAEGNRLDMLAKLRLLARAASESDESFRVAITNAGRARIDMQDITRAVRGIAGVTYAQTSLNDSDAVDANGMDGHSVCVAVLGGDDAEIARTLRDYIVPGIGSYGNTRVDTEIDGFCRSILFLRPIPVPVWLSLDLRVSVDRNGCPPPAPAALAVALAQDLSGDTRPVNGADVTLHLLRSTLAQRHSNVEIVNGAGGVAATPLSPLPMVIGFDQIAEYSADRISITVVA
jgi:hypothetical protein